MTLTRVCILGIALVLSSCNNSPAIKKTAFTTLDSLLNFDTLIAVYTYPGLPPKITDDSMEEGDRLPPLYIDSVGKWTNSLSVLDSVRKIFPKCVISNEGEERVACDSYNELFLVTKHSQHTIHWVHHSGHGSIAFQPGRIIYKTNLDKLNSIENLFDRKIIRKEIYAKDTANYKIDDPYNKNYTAKEFSWGPTRFVFILR